MTTKRVRADRNPARSPGRAPKGNILGNATTVVGLDLAGSPHRRTGFCALRDGRDARTAVLGDDSEILRTVRAAAPAIVAIDAPLSLPDGRRDIEDRSGPHFRECDRELRRLGIRFFPLTLGPMRMLTVRGMRLRSSLESLGFRVFESYPGGVQDVLGWPRKGEGAEALRQVMLAFGFRGDVERTEITHDELDAVACAHVARLFLQGRGRLIGNPEEGLILLPAESGADAPRNFRPLRAKPTGRSSARKFGSARLPRGLRPPPEGERTLP